MDEITKVCVEGQRATLNHLATLFHEYKVDPSPANRATCLTAVRKSFVFFKELMEDVDLVKCLLRLGDKELMSCYFDRLVMYFKPSSSFSIEPQFKKVLVEVKSKFGWDVLRHYLEYSSGTFTSRAVFSIDRRLLCITLPDLPPPPSSLAYM